MRVWDIDPGFLNDKSLLGEHREVHAILSILELHKKGYANHPETLRWKNHLQNLVMRHDLLAQEMALRNFDHKSPASTHQPPTPWPLRWVTPADKQFELLKVKYADKPMGRIPLPINCSDLWASYKYSVLARNPALYRNLGEKVAHGLITFKSLAKTLVLELRHPPAPGRLSNAISHMWGYLKKKPAVDIEYLSNNQIIKFIQKHAIQDKITYLLRSTALDDLGYWCAADDALQVR